VRRNSYLLHQTKGVEEEMEKEEKGRNLLYLQKRGRNNLN